MHTTQNSVYIMIRELDALEFLSMVALAEYESGNNKFRRSMNDLLQNIYAIEESCPDVRINFSSRAIYSSHMHSKIIVISNNELSINTIDGLPLLRWYEPEKEIREKCLSIIKHINK